MMTAFLSVLAVCLGVAALFHANESGKFADRGNREDEAHTYLWAMAFMFLVIGVAFMAGRWSL